MCFGKTWSLVSFGILAAASVICITHNAPVAITLSVIFLATKELLQLGLYLSISSCNTTNTFLTSLSWIHISFQPFIVNLFISAFSQTPDLYKIPLIMSLVFAIANIFRLKEMRGTIKYKCQNNIQQNMCRPKTCSIKGKHHVAYGFELASADHYAFITPSFFTYYLLTFVPAYIIGDWQLATIHLIFAIGSMTFIQDAGEAGAIWCVNSFWIGFFAIYYVFKGNPFHKN